MPWIYVAVIVVSTVASDLLQSWEMKRHGEVTGIGRLLKLLLTKAPLIGSSFFSLSRSTPFWPSSPSLT